MSINYFIILGHLLVCLTNERNYVQYEEDFKFWVMAAGNAHRLLEKDIVLCFCQWSHA